MCYLLTGVGRISEGERGYRVPQTLTTGNSQRRQNYVIFRGHHNLTYFHPKMKRYINMRNFVTQTQPSSNQTQRAWLSETPSNILRVQLYGTKLLLNPSRMKTPGYNTAGVHLSIGRAFKPTKLPLNPPRMKTPGYNTAGVHLSIGRAFYPLSSF